MTNKPQELVPLPGTYAICRLDRFASVPDLKSKGFLSMTRTDDELSIVCEQNDAPPAARCEFDWKCLRVAGTIDFSVTGVIASLTAPLAAADLGVFVVSTF